tara:strand:+ start:59464 stop:61953 length:2490 start_codon:yes stop_codon:yes gene_type:complete
MKFRKPPIAVLIGLSIVIPLLVVVGIGLYGIVQVRALDGIAKEVEQNLLPKHALLRTIRQSTASLNLLVARQTQSNHLPNLAPVSSQIAMLKLKTDIALQDYGKVSYSSQEISTFTRLNTAITDYHNSLAHAENVENKAITTPETEQFYVNSGNAFAGALQKTDALEKIVHQQVQDARSRGKAIVRQAVFVILLLIAGSTMAAIVGTLRAVRAVATPLERISNAMRRLMEGDENVDLGDIAGASEEMAALISATKGYRDSVIQARELAEVAEGNRSRLASAIDNMPIGLCMFDNDNRLIVCNEKYAALYKLRPELTVAGTSHAAINAERIRQKTFHGPDPEAYLRDIEETVVGKIDGASICEINDGRTISVVFQPMRGGWLATHEDITDRRRSEARIFHMSRHDALTDLPNRTLFSENVNQALTNLAEDQQLAVLGIDLDHFKDVNDSLGHPIGDRVLQTVAKRLQSTLRESDTVARFGGDEFAVVQVNPDQPAAAHALAQRLIDTISKTIQIDGQTISIGASIGIAMAPTDGNTAEILLKNADLAMYRSKEEGRGVYHFFEPEMDARMQTRRQMALDLHRALTEGEFVLHYQPLMNVEANVVCGFEALLRWNHPERGMVSPAEFIPVAEEIGLIIPLGEWVLHQACKDANSWPDDIRVAVNLSPAQFRSHRLAETVMTTLSISQLLPRRLELEITEGVLLTETEETLSTLHRLRELGVFIAMDDFGTGYSSLSYLQRFPFDKIKIDSSFVRAMNGEENTMAIIRAVTSLGASLGMTTTAEGVETEEQLEWVRREGCTEVQGFLFSKGVPANEVGAIIEKLGSKAAVAA